MVDRKVAYFAAENIKIISYNVVKTFKVLLKGFISEKHFQYRKKELYYCIIYLSVITFTYCWVANL